MSAILYSLNAHNLPIFQPILMTLITKFMVQRALSDKTYLSERLLFLLKITLKAPSCSNYFKHPNINVPC